MGSGRKGERARARETCLFLARPFFLAPTTSKRLLRRLSGFSKHLPFGKSNKGNNIMPGRDFTTVQGYMITSF